jgi:hypothetical protein
VRRAFPVIAALALAAGGLVAAQVQRGRTGQEIRASAETAARTAPFTAAGIAHRRDDGSSFLEIAVDGADDTFVMTPRDRAGHPRCQGVVTSARHEALLDAVRGAEAVLARDPSPCTPVVGEPLRTYRWSLPERGGQTREVGLTAACTGAFPELDGLYAALDALAFSAVSTAGALTCAPPATGAVE